MDCSTPKGAVLYLMCCGVMLLLLIIYISVLLKSTVN